MLDAIQKFKLGEVYATPGAAGILAPHETLELVRRHAALEQGDLCADDYAANLDAFERGGRILSAFRVGAKKIWVITEASRESTTILLPDEY